MPKERTAHSDKECMNELDDGFDLISQMVNETFSGVEDTESVDAFELSLVSAAAKAQTILDINVSEPIQLEFQYDYYLGAFDENRNCFIFQIEDQVIEIPSNWGPFKFSTYQSGVFEDLFSLEKHEDVDLFFDIIEGILHKSLKSLKCQNQATHLKLCYELEEEQQMAQIIPFRGPEIVKAA